MNDSHYKALEIERELITDFKMRFEETLGYTPIILTKYECNEFFIPLMSLKHLAEYFDPFLPIQYDKKVTLFSKSRKREIVELRMIFCFLARSMRNSLSTIGNFLGGRDHTTVMYNVTTFTNLMETSSVFKNQFYQIINYINQNYEPSTLDKSYKTQHISEPAVLS
jgi:hypothetical protein